MILSLGLISSTYLLHLVLDRGLLSDDLRARSACLIRGETGSGINFRSIVFVPSELPPDFWHKAGEGVVKNVRMMVKRVFITDDLGENFLPKWLSFLKVVVDGQYLGQIVHLENSILTSPRTFL